MKFSFGLEARSWKRNDDNSGGLDIWEVVNSGCGIMGYIDYFVFSFQIQILVCSSVVGSGSYRRS